MAKTQFYLLKEWKGFKIIFNYLFLTDCITVIVILASFLIHNQRVVKLCPLTIPPTPCTEKKKNNNIRKNAIGRGRNLYELSVS